MNQEQYTNAMLKIAYHAGRAMAIAEIEKEGADGKLIDPPIVRNTNAPSNQARNRGENKALPNIHARNTISRPRGLSKSLKPKPTVGLSKRVPNRRAMLKSTEPLRRQ